MSGDPIVLDLKQLLELDAAARLAAVHAYAPYSSFRVGAGLLLATGEMVTGTNVENVSYGLTICAERSAISRMIAEYGSRARVVAVSIANLNDAPSSPCGACRQVLAEFMSPDGLVSFPSGIAGRDLIRVPLRELLPFAFALITQPSSVA